MAHADARRLTLLGTWGLEIDGRRVHLGSREERVLALVALRGPQLRTSIVGLLWPDSTETHGRSNLRTSLMRLRAAHPDLVVADRTSVCLGSDIWVDVQQLLDHIYRVEADVDASPSRMREGLAAIQGPELLTGWYDDWVLHDRERLQHRRIRALDHLAHHLLSEGDTDLAITAAEEALTLEPLLESTAGVLIKAHLHAGNHSTALLTYRRFRALLDRELGVPPSRALTDLVARAVALPT